MCNILFLTLSNISNIDEHGIYQDLLREFARKGHRVFVVSPIERRNQEKTHLIKNDNVAILRVRTGNIQKTNLLEKGIATVFLETQYMTAIKKYLSDVKFDLVLYSTPPITLASAVKYIKKRDKSRSYLMLKDIFPQNAVDMGMMKMTGVMRLIWKYFRKKEKKLYKNSDFIGCMSPANCRYVLQHNPEIPKERVGICVNSYSEEPVRVIDKNAIRERYGIPKDKVAFLYGGNLGKPQGLSYFVDVMKSNKNKEDRFFLICGGGNDQKTILKFIEQEKPKNVKIMSTIPSDDFDDLSRACDVGLVFLDHRFTIPNFPSRMLSIMLNEKPILAATDSNTDVGEVIADGNMGWWCESTDIAPFNRFLNEICEAPELAKEKGRNARKYYETHYTSKIAYQQILKGLEKVGE